MPLKVQNSEPNMTVFTKPELNLKISWGPKGSHNDTQRVPDSLVDDIDFLNSLESGILVVLDCPEHLKERLEFETEAVKAFREESQAKAMESIDRRQERDFISQTCVGPAPAGRDGECGKNVLMRAKDRTEHPPLCDIHKELAPHFYLAESGSKGEGATESKAGEVTRTWKRAEMTDRVVQAQ